MTDPVCPRCDATLPRLAAASGLALDVFVLQCPHCERPARAGPHLVP